MNPEWIPIAEALRHEIAEYGGLLHRFDQQQHALFARDPDGVLRCSTGIEEHVRAMQECRTRREELVAQFAESNHLPRTTTLRALLPRFAADVRPLLEALVNEVNVLIHRIRRISRHNHLLLARAVETHQQTLRALRPDSFTQTYASSGRSTLAPVRPTPALQAAG